MDEQRGCILTSASPAGSGPSPWLRGVALAALVCLALSGCSHTEASQPVASESAPPSPPRTLNDYTTETTIPLDEVDTARLGLGEPGVLRAGTVSDSPPKAFTDAEGEATGYDNELLEAMAARLGLEVEFISLGPEELLADVAEAHVDVGSASLQATSEAREAVGFTNGYDFTSSALVTREDAKSDSFEDALRGKRIGVIRGSVEEDYAVNGLGLDPMRLADPASAHQAVKDGDVEAWLAPIAEAQGQVRHGDGTEIAAEAVNDYNVIAYAVAKDNTALVGALNAALDSLVRDGTWGRLAAHWHSDRPTLRELAPGGWRPGSRSVELPPGDRP